MQFIFSPLGSVERELGELTTTDPVTTTTDPKKGPEEGALTAPVSPEA